MSVVSVVLRHAFDLRAALCYIYREIQQYEDTYIESMRTHI